MWWPVIRKILGVVRLKRAVEVHNLAELRIAGASGLDAEGPDSGKHDVNFTSVIYSPPVNDNWRGFAGFGYADGQFSEGKGIVRDWLAGVNGVHVISGWKQNTPDAISIMNINPAQDYQAGTISTTTGVSAQSCNASPIVYRCGQ